MSALGTKLRRTKTGILHWCPACNETHHYTTDGSRGWTFNGDAEKPSFSPSMKITWGRPPETCCHYFLTDGVIHYCADSTHNQAGKSVPLPDWPYAPNTYGGIEEED